MRRPLVYLHLTEERGMALKLHIQLTDFNKLIQLIKINKISCRPQVH